MGTTVPASRPGRRLSASAGLALAVLLLAAMPGAVSATVTVLPLGDSITHGGNGDGGALYPTYRAWLYQDLRGLGYDVDFVGSLDQPAAPAGGDPDNEGHAAFTAGQVLAELSGWLAAYPPPQVALVHLGTNDAIQGVPVDQTARDLVGIVTALRDRNPAMTVLVAQIVPTSVASTNARIEVLNAEIARLAALSTPQSPVVVVDQYTGFDIGADLQSGGAHPSTSGEKRMAARWLEVLVPVLNGAVPAPAVTTPSPVSTPTPTVMPDPTQAPEPVATVTATPTVTSRFGLRNYRIGAVPTRAAGGGISFRTVRGTTRTRVTAQGAATLAPPATSFTRWYPAARWSTGLR